MPIWTPLFCVKIPQKILFKPSKKWIKCVCYLWMVLIQLEIYGDNVFAHRIRNKEKGMTETVSILNCKFIEIKHKFNKFSTIYWKSEINFAWKFAFRLDCFIQNFHEFPFFPSNFKSVECVCIYGTVSGIHPKSVFIVFVTTTAFDCSSFQVCLCVCFACCCLYDEIEHRIRYIELAQIQLTPSIDC